MVIALISIPRIMAHFLIDHIPNPATNRTIPQINARTAKARMLDLVHCFTKLSRSPSTPGVRKNTIGPVTSMAPWKKRRIDEILTLAFLLTMFPPNLYLHPLLPLSYTETHRDATAPGRRERTLAILQGPPPSYALRPGQREHEPEGQLHHKVGAIHAPVAHERGHAGEEPQGYGTNVALGQ